MIVKSDSISLRNSRFVKSGEHSVAPMKTKRGKKQENDQQLCIENNSNCDKSSLHTRTKSNYFSSYEAKKRRLMDVMYDINNKR